jgi:hypothetical protein
MFDMPVIARFRDQEHCASITGMIRHYAEPEGRVIFDHRHNAEMSIFFSRISMHNMAYSLTGSLTLPVIAAQPFPSS